MGFEFAGDFGGFVGGRWRRLDGRLVGIGFGIEVQFLPAERAIGGGARGLRGIPREHAADQVECLVRQRIGAQPTPGQFRGQGIIVFVFGEQSQEPQRARVVGVGGHRLAVGIGFGEFAGVNPVRQSAAQLQHGFSGKDHARALVRRVLLLGRIERDIDLSFRPR